jgi:predicted ribosomally synthesized peptide with nif11-like leader
MSQKSFSDFVKNVNTDKSLGDALRERFGDVSQQIPAEELIGFAGEHGYDFNVEEAGEELSEGALEGVAGGVDSLMNTEGVLSSYKVTLSKPSTGYVHFKFDISSAPRSS